MADKAAGIMLKTAPQQRAWLTDVRQERSS
jgi:hypothetical protein